MKRYFVLALVLAAASAVSLGAQSKPATAAGDDEIVKADRALVMAFEKGDHAALNKLLDPDFSWIDTDGIMWAREDVLRAGLKPLVPSGPDVTITEHKCRQGGLDSEQPGQQVRRAFLGAATCRMAPAPHQRNRDTARRAR